MVEALIKIVSKSYKVKPRQLTGKSRVGVLPEARRMAALFIVRECGFKAADAALKRSRGHSNRAIIRLKEEMDIYPSVRERFESISLKVKFYNMDH